MLNRGNSLCEQYETLRAQATGEYPGIATPSRLSFVLAPGDAGLDVSLVGLRIGYQACDTRATR